MPPRRWTSAQDVLLCQQRRAGAGWPAIAAALGVSVDVARERGRRIGALPPPRPPSPHRPPAPDLATRPPSPHRPPAPDLATRPPLPPGDPRSWGLLTAGTVLAGLAWPGWG